MLSFEHGSEMTSNTTTAGWDPKREAMRLWNADPCGGAAGEDVQGSAAFFKAIDRDRYVNYAPWLPAAAEFEEHRGERLLEVGCGMGTDLASFARGGARTVAVDLTVRHLAIAAQRLRGQNTPTRLVRSDGEVLPFPNDTFDVVYSFGVLHHTPGTQAAIDEVHRVLKPGGRAIIAMYHRGSVFYWFYTILVRGIAKGGLARRGYRRLVADIEQHDHTDALPLVKVYSRAQMRRLFSRFSAADTEVHHLEPGHFSYLAPIVRAVPASWRRAAAHRWGWYVFAKATK
jgi:ubiquinone/menaquinone biosynthesis C-methylase UbiE